MGFWQILKLALLAIELTWNMLEYVDPALNGIEKRTKLLVVSTTYSFPNEIQDTCDSAQRVE